MSSIVSFKHIVSASLFATTKFAADANNSSYYVGDDVATLHFGTPDVMYQDLCFCKGKELIYTHAKFYKCGSDGLKQVDCSTYNAADGEIVQHVGATANGFVHGYIYKKTVNVVKTIPSGTTIYKTYNKSNNHLLISDDSQTEEDYGTRSYRYTASDGSTSYRVYGINQYYSGEVIGMYIPVTSADNYYRVTAQDANSITLDNGVILTWGNGGSGGGSTARIWYDSVTGEEYYSIANMAHCLISKDYYIDNNTRELLPTEPIGGNFDTIEQETLQSDYIVGDSFWTRINVQPLQLTLNNNNVIYTDSIGTTHQLATKDDIQGTAPLGAILPFAGSTIPDNWMLCDGSAVSRTTYAELFSLIGTAYGDGDGSTTFNIPDLREVVPVGAGTSTRSGISDHDSYNVGEFKDDQLQDHAHAIYTSDFSDPSVSGDTYAASSFVLNKINKDWNILKGRKGTTTHGKQLGVNYIIRVLNGTSETPSETINYNNIPIVFSENSSLAQISSGETLATLFSKIKRYLHNPKQTHSGYKTNNDTITLVCKSHEISYYQSAVWQITSHGNEYSYGILRLSHGDSWYARVTSLESSLNLDVESCSLSGSVITITLKCTISGNNKYTFHSADGIFFDSIT